jgi:release factor glutamine methyltransferase
MSWPRPSRRRDYKASAKDENSPHEPLSQPGIGQERALSRVLRRTSCLLREAGCDTPDLDAELLLTHTLGWERARLRAHPERVLTSSEWEHHGALVARRLAREPLAHILGHREFFGLDFFVDRRVLVPRPETELLVEQVLEWHKDQVTSQHSEGAANGLAQPHAVPSIADVGTGAGCLAISLAAHLPNITVFALDSSAEALQVAASNVARHAMAGRVQLLRSDLLDELPHRVNVIVANLPYVRSDDLAALAPEVRDYEPRLALDGGPDGLAAIRKLLAQAPSRVHAGGLVLLEIGCDQGAAALTLARQHFPVADVAVLPDYAGRDRILRITL